MASQKVIAKGLMMLAELGYVTVKQPDPEVGSPGTVKAWEIGLSDLPDDYVQAAFQFLYTSWKRRFYGDEPTIADLREFVMKASLPDWSKAWAEIQEKKYYFLSLTYDSRLGLDPWDGMGVFAPQWSNPIISEAVRQMGGIEVFNECDAKQENTLRAQFREVFGNISKNKAAEHVKFPQIAAPSEKVIMIAEAQERRKARDQEAIRIDEIADPRAKAGFESLRAMFEKKHNLAIKLSAEKVEKGKASMSGMAEAMGFQLQNLLEDNDGQEVANG